MPSNMEPENDLQRTKRAPYPSLSPALRRRLVLLALIALIIVPPLVRKVMAQPLFQSPLPLAYAYVLSPNCDNRPPDAEINCIVLHATVEPTTEGTMGIFLDPARRVSAHFVVGRDGRVVQMVPVEKRAWHAGPSVLEGVGSVNDYSVGIEIVNLNDGKDPYTPEQMEAVAGLIRFVRSHYTIPDSRIVSHAQIALPPGRKSDPVGLDFDQIRALAHLEPSPLALPTRPADAQPNGDKKAPGKP
jgi:N-acetylmuramoyl-L-alanine amidase